MKVAAAEIDRKFPEGVGVKYCYKISHLLRPKRGSGLPSKLSGEQIVRALLYADDVGSISTTVEESRQILEILDSVCRRFGLYVSFKKTFTQVFNCSDLCDVDSLYAVAGHSIQNVSEFKYLGHLFHREDSSAFAIARVSSAVAQFQRFRYIFTDRNIKNRSKIRFLEAYVRSRLTYGVAAVVPTEAQIGQLCSCWYECLRRMTKGGFARKSVSGGDELSSSFVWSNSDLEKRYGTPPLRDFIHVQFLRYIAHITRRPNDHPTKTALFIEATRKNVKSVWTKVQFLVGLDRDDIISKMVKKEEFERVLAERFPFLKAGATGRPAKGKNSTKKSSSR